MSIAVVVGIAAGAAGVLWWDDTPAPRTLPPNEHAVELILFEVVPPDAAGGSAGSEDDPLRVDGGVLLSGLVASEVTGIASLGSSLAVRAPALPVTVEPDRRFRAVRLEITVRDCAAARRWTPADRPFTIAWRDEYGNPHTDRAGDFGASMATSLTRYVDRVCGAGAD